MPKPKRLKAIPVDGGDLLLPRLTKRARHLLLKYGITEEQYDLLLRQQKGSCAVCGRSAKEFKVRLCIDHDHTTGSIRGLLCNYCNRRIVGRHRLGKGDLLLKAAYEYLTKDYPGWTVPPKRKKRKKSSKARRKRRLLDG